MKLKHCSDSGHLNRKQGRTVYKIKLFSSFHQHIYNADKTFLITTGSILGSMYKALLYTYSLKVFITHQLHHQETANATKHTKRKTNNKLYNVYNFIAFRDNKEPVQTWY